jgi:hypothetical protein
MLLESEHEQKKAKPLNECRSENRCKDKGKGTGKNKGKDKVHLRTGQ